MLEKLFIIGRIDLSKGRETFMEAGNSKKKATTWRIPQEIMHESLESDELASSRLIAPTLAG